MASSNRHRPDLGYRVDCDLRADEATLKRKLIHKGVKHGAYLWSLCGKRCKGGLACTTVKGSLDWAEVTCLVCWNRRIRAEAMEDHLIVALRTLPWKESA